MPRPFPLSSACLGIVCCLTSGLLAQDDGAFRAERAKYQGYLQRESLRKRTDGRCYFADTKDLRAFDILVKSYAKPEEPRDHNKYLIATITMDAFAESAPDETLAKWRKRQKKPVDAWMWYETLRIDRMRKRRDEIIELASSKNNAYVRAGARAALIDHVDSYSMEPDFAAWLSIQLDELPKKPVERALVLEFVGEALLEKKGIIRKDPWKELCRKLIKTTFDVPETPRRSKVVIARYLAETFDVQNLGFESVHWNVELDRTPNAKRRNSGTTSSVGFAGIRTKGDHIVFVIDASDSMCKPVSNLKKVDLGPTTGDKPEVEEGVVPTADDLDWNRIRTRFDAAREFLRVAMGTLKAGTKFSVVLFGDEAIPLAATKTLTKVSKKSVRKALNELYAIKTGAPTDTRPDGTLRGKTNFHGGLRLAYRMTKSGVTKKAEYADDKSMIEGCDTIFILSDGAPSTDDWYALDDREPHDNIGDPESKKNKDSDAKRIWMDGPYGQADDRVNQHYRFLVSDVKRMNLLRRCEIHCVAIGEADANFLGKIAKIGHGRSIRIDSRVGKK